MTHKIFFMMPACVAFLYGCGPAVSGAQIRHANIALSAAITAGAQQHAPYEYRATEYLHVRRMNAY
ncbi:MAG: hypothetical protein R3C68_08255 [Myxococcota bacterium]